MPNGPGRLPFRSQEAPGAYRLKQTVKATKDPDKLVQYLNSLADVEPKATDSCNLMGHDQFPC
jgi:hypothetical protein